MNQIQEGKSSGINKKVAAEVNTVTNSGLRRNTLSLQKPLKATTAAKGNESEKKTYSQGSMFLSNDDSECLNCRQNATLMYYRLYLDK